MLTAVAVTGASAADFEVDDGPCPETPSEKQLSRCPTGFVGRAYEVQLESEEGSGCSPSYDYFVLVGALPPGLTMTRDGLISGTPTTAGFYRFWIHNHDLPYWEGGPGWCIRDDTSEREFSIAVDPVLAIDNTAVKPATVGQAYSDTFTAKRLVTLNPPSGSQAPAKWSLQGGALPPGLALSEQGALTGTPTAEGSFHFVVKAQDGNPVDVRDYTLSVRQPVRVSSPLGPAPPARSEVGVRLEKTFTASGGTGTYTWAVASGALPTGVVLDAARGTVSGAPQAAGAFTFALTATDSEGRATTAAAALTVAPRLTISTLRLKAAKVARTYRLKLATAGGVGPVRWSIVRGKLAPGLKLAQTTGTLTGRARRSGRFTVTLRARDALGVTSQRTLRLVVGA
jgi:hypothetical protein